MNISTCYAIVNAIRLSADADNCKMSCEYRFENLIT